MKSNPVQTSSHFDIRRGTLRSVAALAVASVAAVPMCVQAKPEKARVIISVGGKASFYHLPLTIAEQLGFFRDEGLDVKLDDHNGGAMALQAMLRGSADVVAGAYEHTISQQLEKRDLQAFVMEGRTPQIALGISAKALPDYKSLADLRGRRIGVSAPGSSTNMVANVALSRVGLKPADVHYVGVGSAGGAIDALRSGQVDALCNTDPVITMLEQKGELRVVLDTRTLKGTAQVFGGAMPSGCLYAPLAFLEKNPQTAQALANGIVRSLKWLQTAGPSDIIRSVPEAYLLGDRALYLASFNRVHEAFSIDGLITEEGAKVALKALVSFDASVKADKVDLSRTYTNVYARKAKDRFKA
ncbi:MAG: hypothetical protein RJA34_2443 [Pseudomonadota bacterium]|jgi:NitT/TauT family transport system substrate-binding protein